MEASDFLDIGKRRLLRVRFPDFTMYGGFSGLLDVHISEIVNDSPDITIGGLVVPEITLSLDNTQGGTMASVLHQEAVCEIGLEQSHEDVTKALQAMQAQHPGRQLCFVRCSTGQWIISDGMEIYIGDGIWHSQSEITGLYLDEIRNRLYLLHETGAAATWYETDAAGLTGTEQTVYPVSALHEAVLRDVPRHRTGLTETKTGAILTELKESVYFKDGALRHDILSGTVATYECTSYGSFTMTDTNIQDDDTMEAIGYGELGKLAGIPVEEFFTEQYIHSGDTLFQVLHAFLEWLSGKGASLELGEQTFLNLDKMTVCPEWADTDYSGLTASDFMRDLAMHEGGNAYLDKSGKLMLGWCSEEITMTITADEMAYLRLGTDMLTSADGFRYTNSAAQNCIWTEAKGISTSGLVGTEAFAASFDAVTASFADVSVLPFKADVLAGASPLLRAGDCIRVVTKNGAAVKVPVLMQDVEGFPFLQSRIESPDGTTWHTVPVELLDSMIVRLDVNGWPESVPYGEIPDFSGLTVTAWQRNGECFYMPSGSCHLTYREADNCIIAEISYAGITETKSIPITEPLPPIPEGYTRLTAIKSEKTGSGINYCATINTLVKMSPTIRIEFDMRMEPDEINLTRFLGAVRKYGTTVVNYSAFSVGVYPLYGIAVMVNAKAETTGNINIDTQKRYVITVETLDEGTHYIFKPTDDEPAVEWLYSKKLTGILGDVDEDALVIGGIYRNPEYASSSPITMYSCKIYDGSELIRDFIPVMRNADQVCGMFDLVEDKFYTKYPENQYTADFVPVYEEE